MPDIAVKQIGPEKYRVEVAAGSGSSVHEVGATEQDVRRLGGGRSGEELIEESFRFLLERESSESIMSSFHILVIARYFPEYLDEFPARMEAAPG